MGRLFKKHPLTVFRVVTSDQGLFALGGERTFDALRRAAFCVGNMDTIESCSGAVVLENYLSSNFGPGNIEFGEYIVFSIRTDTRKVPGSALRLAVDTAMRDELEAAKAMGASFISRERKREIKEQCKLRLMAKTVPSPKVADCWWNVKTGLAYLTDKSPSQIETFKSIFSEAFGPESYLEEFTLTESYAHDQMTGDLLLNWMWQERATGCQFSDKKGVNFIAALDDKIVISEAGNEVRGTSESRPISQMSEIEAGINDGKRVNRAAFTIESAGEELARLEIDTSINPILSMSIPRITHHDEDEFAGALLEQIGNIEEAFDLLTELVTAYTDTLSG